MCCLFRHEDLQISLSSYLLQENGLSHSGKTQLSRPYNWPSVRQHYGSLWYYHCNEVGSGLQPPVYNFLESNKQRKETLHEKKMFKSYLNTTRLISECFKSLTSKSTTKLGLGAQTICLGFLFASTKTSSTTSQSSNSPCPMRQVHKLCYDIL